MYAYDIFFSQVVGKLPPKCHKPSSGKITLKISCNTCTAHDSIQLGCDPDPTLDTAKEKVVLDKSLRKQLLGLGTWSWEKTKWSSRKTIEIRHATSITSYDAIIDHLNQVLFCKMKLTRE